MLADSFRLAARIHADGYRPKLIIGIWRGGTPVAIAIQEYFAWRGISAEHCAIKTASYAGLDERSRNVEVAGLAELAGQLKPDSRLLIVDDVFDTGLSIQAVLKQLRDALGAEMPAHTRIACPWFKPTRNRTEFKPHYYLHETSRWLVFPHELIGLSEAEIRAGKPELALCLDELKLFDPPRR